MVHFSMSAGASTSFLAPATNASMYYRVQLVLP
jgi:hypothetical protein